jgi:hypothetical protein
MRSAEPTAVDGIVHYLTHSNQPWHEMLADCASLAEGELSAADEAAACDRAITIIEARLVQLRLLRCGGVA